MLSTDRPELRCSTCRSRQIREPVPWRTVSERTVMLESRSGGRHGQPADPRPRPRRRLGPFPVQRAGLAAPDPRHRLRIGLDRPDRPHRPGSSVAPSRRSIRPAAGSCTTPIGTNARPRRAWQPRWPRWLVDRVGADYLGNVVFVNLHDRGTDAGARPGRAGSPISSNCTVPDRR